MLEGRGTPHYQGQTLQIIRQIGSIYLWRRVRANFWSFLDTQKLQNWPSTKKIFRTLDPHKKIFDLTPKKKFFTFGPKFFSAFWPQNFFRTPDPTTKILTLGPKNFSDHYPLTSPTWGSGGVPPAGSRGRAPAGCRGRAPARRRGAAPERWRGEAPEQTHRKFTTVNPNKN